MVDSTASSSSGYTMTPPTRSAPAKLRSSSMEAQNSFLSPPKKPRGGPNCRANTPMPVPSRRT